MAIETGGREICKKRDHEPWVYHQFKAGDPMLGEPHEILVKKGSIAPDIIK